MIETSWLTRHERGVLTVALRDYTNRQHTRERTAAGAEGRATAKANAYVADDLLRQLSGR